MNVNAAQMSSRWQDVLAQYCRLYQIAQLEYHILSDRRGGRTAWTTRLIVKGHTFLARNSYDGRNVNGAKEDAAEVACLRLGIVPPATQIARQHQHQQQQQQGHWGAIVP